MHHDDPLRILKILCLRESGNEESATEDCQNIGAENRQKISASKELLAHGIFLSRELHAAKRQTIDQVWPNVLVCTEKFTNRSRDVQDLLALKFQPDRERKRSLTSMQHLITPRSNGASGFASPVVTTSALDHGYLTCCKKTEWFLKSD